MSKTECIYWPIDDFCLTTVLYRNTVQHQCASSCHVVISDHLWKSQNRICRRNSLAGSTTVVVLQQEGNGDSTECAVRRSAELLCRRVELRSRVLVGHANSLSQTCSGFPSESMHAADIEQLLRCAIRTRRVEENLAIEFENLGDKLCQFENREILARADVDEGSLIASDQAAEFRRRQVEKMNTRVGEIVAVEKFAPWLAGTPHHQAMFSGPLCLDYFPHQRRQNVRQLRVEVVSRTIKICGHGREITSPVLPVIRPAHLHPRNLCQSVRAIGWLERAREQIFLFDRLRSELRIDAARAEKEQTLDTAAV